MNKITKYFRKKLIFDNIEFELNGCSLIIGENGSGKTTLFRILSGLLKNYDGSIETDNNVSLLLDSPNLYLFRTGNENLLYFLDLDEYRKAQKYIEYFHMNSYINKYVKTYSNGMRKKLSLIIAISRNKEYLLLDEPSNSLDSQSIELLKNILVNEKENKKIFIASHDIKMVDINLIDNVFMLKNKKITSLNIKKLDFLYYKVKTINEINETKYEFKIKDGYYIFKVFKDCVNDFSKFISSFNVLEMVKIDLCDSVYMEDLYND